MTFRRLKKLTYLGLIFLDFLGVLLAFLLAYLLRSMIPGQTDYLPEREYIFLSVVLGIFYVVILHTAGTHKRHPFGSYQVEILAVSSALLKGTFLFMALAFLYRGFSVSRLIVVFHLVLAVLILCILRLLWRILVVKTALKSGAGKRILALVRSEGNGSSISNSGKNDRQLVVIQTFNPDDEMRDLENFIELHRIDGIEIAERDYPHGTVLEIALTAAKMGIDLRVKPDLVELLPLNFSMEEIDGRLYWTTGRGLREIYPRTLKRLVDFLLSFLMIIIFLIPGLVVAILIASTSSGGIFYRHKRIGRKGRQFLVLKFRTMYTDAEERLKKDGELYSQFLKGFKLKNDPRITPIGKFLRRTSLDEIPQIYNILKGEMSFVGPRPVVQKELERYGELKDLLMSVPPGLTGLWQVSGRSDLSYEERVRLDLYYVENWSLALDTQIIGRTLPALLFSKGAY
jgi:exopolysaccharide biosynthesis polyprenyl glycosylphosphotransferase